MSSREQNASVSPLLLPDSSESSISHPNKRVEKQRKIIFGLVVCTAIFAIGFFVSSTLLLWNVTSRDDDSDGNKNPFNDLVGFCDRVNPISGHEFQIRRQKLFEGLREFSVDGMVFETSASMEYFTGVQWSRSERPLLFLAIRNQTTPFAFVVSSFEAQRLKQSIGFDVSVDVWEEDESPYEKAKLLMQQRLGEQATYFISIEASTRLFVVQGFLNLPQIQLKESNELIRQIRMVKSPAELEILSCANRATKAALQAVYSLIHEGISDKEVHSLIDRALLTAGLSNTWHLVLFGPAASYPHGTEGTRFLDKSEMILIDTGGELHGYQSDITRTFQLHDGGTASQNQTKLQAWNLVKQAQLAALAAIRPGAVASDIDAAARKVIVDGGYGPGFRFFTHRLGHGIGLEGHEDPYMVGSNNNTRLLPGMTFSVEPGIYVLDDFGVRLEDIVTVTDTGYEVFGELANTLDDPFKNNSNNTLRVVL